jgi:RND family efflux transporter MFP subunit
VNTLKFLVLFSVVVAFAVLLASCAGDLNQEHGVKLQKVIALTPVKKSGYQAHQYFNGRVKFSQQVDLSFEEAGQISKMMANEGDVINKGHVLATLDTQLLDALSEQLNSKLDDTESKLSLASKTFKRHKSMQIKGFSSAQTIDELDAEQYSLRASMDQLKEELNAIEIRLSKTKLIAPFNAEITQRYVDTGAVVDSRNPVFQLLESAAVELHVGIPVGLIKLLKIGQAYQVTIAEHKLSATLVSVGSHVETRTGTVSVRFYIDAPQIRHGQLAVVTVEQWRGREGYWIPLLALTDGLRGTWKVLTLEHTNNSKQADNVKRVGQINVSILHIADDKVYVAGDLENRSIIRDGLHRLVQNQLVEVINDKSKLTGDPH